MGSVGLTRTAAVLVLFVVGCGGVISREVSRRAAPLDSFAELREDPARFVGETVVLGGEVIAIRNQPDTTTLVVLEKPLESGERPTTEDESDGRYLVRFARYLDPALFAPGRRITVAGAVTGVETEAVGDAPYRYVVLQGVEIHLWKDPVYAPPFPWYEPRPWYPLWYDPYWGRRPWWW